jgi:hypothetical protein
VNSYTQWDEWTASPTAPLPAEDVGHRVNVAEDALLALFSGVGNNWVHWDICITVVNFMETFVRLGYALDPDGLVRDSHAALRAARRRAESEKSAPMLTVPEAGIVLGLVCDYSECLRETSAKSAVRAMRATEAGMRKLRRG